MGHKINVGGSAIINIDSVLSNVTQTIGAAPGLDSAQKSQLEGLVQSLRADLDKLPPLEKCRIDIGRRSLAFPVTPPYVRVRIRRFGGLSYRLAANLGRPMESK